MRRLLAMVWGVGVVTLGIAWLGYAIIGPRVFRERIGRPGIIVVAVFVGCLVAPLGIATIAAGLQTCRNLLRRNRQPGH